MQSQLTLKVLIQITQAFPARNNAGIDPGHVPLTVDGTLNQFV